MSRVLTTCELCSAGIVPDAVIADAVRFYLAGPMSSEFALTQSYVLNVHHAVEKHPWAREALAEPRASEHLKRALVRSAILRAIPERRPS